MTERLAALSEAQEHPWGLAGARGAAPRSCAWRMPTTSAQRRSSRLAAAAYGALGLPFERARSLLALGRAQRRAKKWGTARESLTRSAAAFDRLGSPGWADDARSELQRVGARRAAPAAS